MTLKELQKDVHQNAIDHGWWDGEQRTFGELIALCHSELSEALEELRNGHAPKSYYMSFGGKPEGVGPELADTVIRILDMCGHYGIDLDEMIHLKHAYNKTRDYRHGGKAL